MVNTVLSVGDFQARAAIARERAARIRSYRDLAMRRALDESGIGAWCGLNVLHNALLSREQGKPWEGVDYSAARRAAYLESRLSEADDIASSYVSRLLRSVR